MIAIVLFLLFQLQRFIIAHAEKLRELLTHGIHDGEYAAVLHAGRTDDADGSLLSVTGGVGCGHNGAVYHLGHAGLGTDAHGEGHFALLADDVCQMVSSKVSEGKMPFLTCTKVLWGVAPQPIFFLRNLCQNRVMQIVVIINVSM